MTPRQLQAVIAALRLFQDRHLPAGHGVTLPEVDLIARGSGQFPILDAEEIDELIEQLQTGEGKLRVIVEIDGAGDVVGVHSCAVNPAGWSWRAVDATTVDHAAFNYVEPGCPSPTEDR